MHDRLSQQIVETSVVAAFGGRVVDLKQRFGFRPADRLMLDRGSCQDARAPGGVVGVQRTGKMNAASGSGTFSCDHPIAHNSQRLGSRTAAGNHRWFEGADRFGRFGGRGRHWYTSHFLFLGQHFHAGVNERLTIRNLGHMHFNGLLICRRQVRQGSGGSQSGPAVMRRTSGNIEAIAFRNCRVFLPQGRAG